MKKKLPQYSTTARGNIDTGALHSRTRTLSSSTGNVIGGPRDVSIHMDKARADGSPQMNEDTDGNQKGEPVHARALLTDALAGGHVSTVYDVAVRGRWLFSAAGDAAVKVS